MMMMIGNLTICV